MSDDVTKCCTTCGRELPLQAFARQARGRYGRESKCRECRAEQQRQRRDADPEGARERQRHWNAANPGKQREYQQRYAERNREERRASWRRYAAAHREERAVARQHWYKANQDAERAKGRWRYLENREGILDQRRDAGLATRDQVFAHYGASCACCGCTDDLTLDHVNGDGASHREELFGNHRKAGFPFYLWLIQEGLPPGYQTLCASCNASKGLGPCCRLDHTKEPP